MGSELRPHKVTSYFPKWKSERIFIISHFYIFIGNDNKQENKSFKLLTLVIWNGKRTWQ